MGPVTGNIVDGDVKTILRQTEGDSAPNTLPRTRNEGYASWAFVNVGKWNKSLTAGEIVGSCDNSRVILVDTHSEYMCLFEIMSDRMQMLLKRGGHADDVVRRWGVFICAFGYPERGVGLIEVMFAREISC